MAINVNWSPDLAVLGQFAQNAGLGEYRMRMQQQAEAAAQRAQDNAFRQQAHKDEMAKASWQADMQNRQFMNQQYMQRMQFGEEAARNRALFGLQAARQADDIAYRQSNAWQQADQQNWQQQYNQAKGYMAYEDQKADNQYQRDALAQKREHDQLLYGFGGSYDRMNWSKEGINEQRGEDAMAREKFRFTAKEQAKVDEYESRIEKISNDPNLPDFNKKQLIEVEEQKIQGVRQSAHARRRAMGPTDQDADPESVRNATGKIWTDTQTGHQMQAQPDGTAKIFRPAGGVDPDHYAKALAAFMSKEIKSTGADGKDKVDFPNPEQIANFQKNYIATMKGFTEAMRDGADPDAVRDPVVREISDLTRDPTLTRGEKSAAQAVAHLIHQWGSFDRMPPAQKRNFQDGLALIQEHIAPGVMDELIQGDGRIRKQQIEEDRTRAQSAKEAESKQANMSWGQRMVQGLAQATAVTPASVPPAAPPQAQPAQVQGRPELADPLVRSRQVEAAEQQFGQDAESFAAWKRNHDLMGKGGWMRLTPEEKAEYSRNVQFLTQRGYIKG